MSTIDICSRHRVSNNRGNSALLDIQTQTIAARIVGALLHLIIVKVGR